MSEPHELEERAEIAWSAERQKWLISGDGERVFSLDDAGMDDPPRFTGLRSECEAFVRAYCLRAVLALVRQEQENGQYSEKINEIWWNEGGPKAPLAEVFRAWWLSHTAPQEK